ncbi:MDR family MFS transporter [Kocuria rosea]|uniref:MDR family MFS transporter n=1 Tax=Kocuria rosea TaxID=1275 RepID=UPI00301AE294
MAPDVPVSETPPVPAPAPATGLPDTGPPAVVADTDHSARNRLVIGLLLVSTFVVILNETIMGVALPRLMADLSVTAVAGQWLTTAYMLTMAVVIPVTGFLLQRLHTRPVFLTAMTLFSLGTLVCAAAPGFGTLLAGRVVQAGGTAIMMPLLMTTVLTLVPPAGRGRVMGNISIVISVAPAVGPTISGVILSVLEWRWMFILVLPIAVGSLLLGAWRMQNVTEPRPAPLDVVSVVLSALGFGGLVYGLSTLGEGGDAALPAWVPLVLGVVALAVFVRRQTRLQRADRALLDLRTFRSRVFTMSTAVLTVSMMALFGTLIVLPIYLQTVHGLDPLGTGLLLLPGGLVMGLLAPFVGRVYDRSGPTVLLVPGSILLSASLWYLASTTGDTPVPMVLLAHVVLSTGLALMFTPLFTAGLGALPTRLYSHGSAMVGTLQQVAGAAGTALFVTVLTLSAAGAAAAGASAPEATEAGVRSAFLCGGIISLLAVVGSFGVRRPAGTAGTESAAGAED